jgi:glycosyltransferase involved in cell wall biosynthesis
MSSFKLPEYMAAGRPIIASDLASIEETLAYERDELLVPAGEVEARVSAVRRLLADSRLAETRGEGARLGCIGMSWDERARRILGWLEEGEGAGNS